MKKIVFVTTQSLNGSTVVGRILPLASELKDKAEVHVIVHGKPSPAEGITLHQSGEDPFTVTPEGKQRLHGISLIWRLLHNSFFSLIKLYQLQPDIVVIVKPLPENTLAVGLWSLLINKTIILDADDFELTANATSSLLQRSAIHASERIACQIADRIVVATPFLSDHFIQLTKSRQKPVLIPTGLPTVSVPHSETPLKDIAYIGSVSIASGHRVDLLPEILEAVRKEVPGTILHIYGSGDDTAKLTEQFRSRNLDDAVVWHGRFNAQNIQNDIASVAVLIDPIDNSVVNRAKSSYRVALAVALGKAIVTSNIGIRTSMIPPQLHDRSFAQPADVQDYAKKIIGYVKQPLTSQETKELQTSSEKNSWPVLAKQYGEILAL